jgi:hypothetical protein
LRGGAALIFSGISDWLTDVSAFFCTEGPAINVAGVTDYLEFWGAKKIPTQYSKSTTGQQILRLRKGLEDCTSFKRVNR